LNARAAPNDQLTSLGLELAGVSLHFMMRVRALVCALSAAAGAAYVLTDAAGLGACLPSPARELPR
jgi:hypothetical protein